MRRYNNTMSKLTAALARFLSKINRLIFTAKLWQCYSTQALQLMVLRLEAKVLNVGATGFDGEINRIGCFSGQASQGF